MDELFKKTEKASKSGKTTSKKKNEVVPVTKKNHIVFMDVNAIELLDKITLTLKLQDKDKKYTKGDIVYEGCKLMAEKYNIDF